MFGLSQKEVSFSITFIIVLILLYFVPLAIALFRKKNNVISIGVLNLLAGWTFVGWLISLIWALKNDQKNDNVVVNQIQGNPEEDRFDKLKKIKGLLVDGVITQEEFENEKNKIMNS